MNLLITGAWENAREHIEAIEDLGNKVVFMQWEKDVLPCDAAWIEGIICNGLFLYYPLSSFPKLRYIQLTSAGYDRIDMDEVKRRNIEIHNARGVYSIPMAEFAVTGVLSIYKRLSDFWEQQEKREWKKIREIRELAGRTVIIVGCGSVGTECAKRFKAFGCEVIGVDVAVRNDDNYDEVKGIESLNEALISADVVVLTVPLTEQTRGLINKKRLELMKNAVLVNISRGPVVDQKALEEWDGTAILDVFEEEPLEDGNPLWKKAIVTPHNSFVGERNKNRLSNVIIENLMR